MNQFKLLPLRLLIFLFLISLLYCSAENENSSEGNTPNTNETSRAITPKKEYTKENSGEWEGVANDHLPEVEFSMNKNKNNLTVKIPGRKFSERHYIEAIGIMDERLHDIDVKYFKRGDKPIAIFSLNSKDYDPEKVKVFAKCNLHDLWTTPLVPEIK